MIFYRVFLRYKPIEIKGFYYAWCFLFTMSFHLISGWSWTWFIACDSASLYKQKTTHSHENDSKLSPQKNDSDEGAKISVMDMPMTYRNSNSPLVT